MQFAGQGKRPPGVVYITSMSRPDAALALSMLYGFQGKNEARMAAVAVCGAGLGAAAFCDAVGRFYGASGPFVTSNNVLPVGLEAGDSLPPDPPMVKPALERRNEKGEPVYVRGVKRLSDTAEVPALIRNSLTGQTDANAVVVLSAAATELARTLELPGARELIAAKVKILVVCDSGGAQDAAALRKVLSGWPTPVVLCGRETGEALPFPASSIEKDFTWAAAHPVVDAYRAYRPMPYDAPSWDMGALFHAVRPDGPLFRLSEPGAIHTLDDGSVKFSAAAGGKHRSLLADPAKKDQIIQAYVELVSAKPVPRQSPVRPQPKKQAEPEKKPE